MGYDIHERDKSGRTALKFLLAKGTDVNTRIHEYSYGNALQTAIFKSARSTVYIFLDHGADISTKGGLYRTALQSAIAADEFEIAKLLLSRGAKLDTGAEWDEMLARLEGQEYRARRLMHAQKQKQENLVEYVEREVAMSEGEELMERRIL